MCAVGLVVRAFGDSRHTYHAATHILRMLEKADHSSIIHHPPGLGKLQRVES